MKNRDYYGAFIKSYRGDDFCNKFILPVILKQNTCGMIHCPQCQLIQALWLDEEYKKEEKDE